MRLPKKTIAWILLATVPLASYITYGTVTNLLRWQLTVVPTTVSFGTTPVSTLTSSQWYNETVVVTTIATFQGGLHVAIDNETATGQTTSFSPNTGSCVFVNVDNSSVAGRQAGGLPGGPFDNLIFDQTTKKTVSNGTSFFVSVNFYCVGHYSIYVSLL
jgi:hypothetical protein